MTDIKAIETRYAGHRLRSRLEARYAVMFDVIGITWHYETEGYRIGCRSYLPDFYLPGTDTWVEVKGSEDKLDKALAKGAARSLPRKKQGPYPRLVILGPIPRPGLRKVDGHDIWQQPCHTTLTVIRDTMRLGLAQFEPEHGLCSCRTPDTLPAGHDGLAAWDHGDYAVQWKGWLAGGIAYMTAPGEREALVAHAYQHASSARFEHGENGAMRLEADL